MSRPGVLDTNRMGVARLLRIVFVISTVLVVLGCEQRGTHDERDDIAPDTAAPSESVPADTVMARDTVSI